MMELDLRKIKPLNGRKEQWRRFRDTNYFVSSEGRVANNYNGTRIVEPRYVKGRWRITTHDKGNKRKTNDYSVNKMQYIAFYGEIPKWYTVENKYGISIPSFYRDLVVVTKSDQGKKTGHLAKSKKVIDLDTGKIYRSTRECAKALYCSYQTVSDCCNHKWKTREINVEWYENQQKQIEFANK